MTLMLVDGGSVDDDDAVDISCYLIFLHEVLLLLLLLFA